MVLKRCKKGFKLDKRKSKCVKAKNPNNPRKKKRKSYNPFKMWGSWVGAILFNILSVWRDMSHFGEPFSTIFLDRIIFFGDLTGKIPFIFFVIIWTIIGFLIGWAIHSLIRRFK